MKLSRIKVRITFTRVEVKLLYELKRILPLNGNKTDYD